MTAASAVGPQRRPAVGPAAPLFRYGWRLGWDLLRHGAPRDALPLLVRPVNYWRVVEYALVLREAGFRPRARVLDVGSPKLLSLYLADRLEAEVFATDIEPYFVERYTRIRALRRLPEARLHLQVEDGRRLSFEDATFDTAYSISVLEHIPDAGDTACVREVARVLKPGGRFVATVPYAPASRDEYAPGRFYWAGSSRREGDRVFFQRRYDEADLHRRLIEPSGLRLARLGFVGERVLVRSRRELSDLLPAVTGPLHPLLSALCHTPLAASPAALAKPLCALIVLDKPGPSG
jgi:SAM-dependent methyltransferase